jgi:hypothetical protein
VRSHCNRKRKKGGMERQQMATTMRVALEGRLMGYRTPGMIWWW